VENVVYTSDEKFSSTELIKKMGQTFLGKKNINEN